MVPRKNFALLTTISTDALFLDPILVFSKKSNRIQRLGLTMARGGDSWEALMITLLMWGTLLGGAGAWVSSCTGTGGTCACGSSSTSCQLVTVADITLTGGICLWTNLAGQTPDVNVVSFTASLSHRNPQPSPPRRLTHISLPCCRMKTPQRSAILHA